MSAVDVKREFKLRLPARPVQACPCSGAPAPGSSPPAVAHLRCPVTGGRALASAARAFLGKTGEGLDRGVASLAVDLEQFPLFSSLSQRRLKRLSRNFKQRRFEPGRTPVRQGHMSEIGFFVITDGEASVSVDSREVTRLGPGDHFAEPGADQRTSPDRDGDP